MDVLTRAQRHRNMVAIGAKNTRPEITVRSLLHVLGYRFRLHSKVLIGKPDIVLRKHKTVIFVHGCFWHQHRGCKYATIPKTRKKFWMTKFKMNLSRDIEVCRILQEKGWKVIIVWECEIKNPQKLSFRLESLLSGN